MDLSELPLVILTAEQKKHLVSFGSIFDPHNVITEGQASFIQMEIKWNARSKNLVLDTVAQLSSGEWIYATEVSFSNNDFLYLLVASEKEHLPSELTSSLRAISDRAAIFTAEELYHEILDSQLATSDPMKLVSYSAEEALQRLSAISMTPANLESVALLLQLLSDYNRVDDPVVYDKTLQLMRVASREDEFLDEYLDAANVIADRLYHLNHLNEAQNIYDRITQLSNDSDRVALNLNSRLQAAQLAKELGQDANGILERISVIDDGLLNFVSHTSQVLFFTLQGAAYELKGQLEHASGYHEMAIAISNTEIIPSVYFAESYGFMAKMDARRLRPDLSTSKFLTASKIAANHKNFDLANYYNDQAAKQELIWADILRSTAINYHMSGKKKDATYSIWQSIRKVIDSYIHGSRTFHKDNKGKHISDAIIQDGYTLVEELEIEYGEDTLKTVEQQLGLVQTGQIPEDQEAEVLRFLTSRISNMIPVPPPIVMIIGLDGRLLLGGQISKTSSTWDRTDKDMNLLFSGALTAIMAMLSEVISEENPLRMLDVGRTQIMIEKTDACIGTVLVDRELVVLRKALRDALKHITRQFPQLQDPSITIHRVNLQDSIPIIEQIFLDALKSF